MRYLFEFLTLLGVAAIGGVVKLWRDVARLQVQQKVSDARLRKIDEMKLEGSLAEIKTQLAHILAILERNENR